MTLSERPIMRHLILSGLFLLFCAHCQAQTDQRLRFYAASVQPMTPTPGSFLPYTGGPNGADREESRMARLPFVRLWPMPTDSAILAIFPDRTGLMTRGIPSQPRTRRTRRWTSTGKCWRTFSRIDLNSCSIASQSR